jgi:3-hydroxyisobutyrate dehydrogenase-like beta-hydroxyacid dehydrogenase
VIEAVGVVGLGSLGEPMAGNALAAGFRVAVFDARREPLERLARSGARIASSLHDLGSSSSVVQILVGNDAQLESVVFGSQGSEGLVAGMAPGTTVLVHSTVHPDTVTRVVRGLEERGFSALDAPVSGEHGAEAAARAREMTFLIGGRASVLDAVRPLLEASGTRIHHLGEVGAGTLTKLAANAMTLVSMESTREALRLVRSAGIDAATALEVWRHTSGRSWAVENWQRMQELAARHPGGRQGLSDLGFKDLGHALHVARRLEAPLPLAALVSQLMEPRFGEEDAAESAELRKTRP